MIFLLYFHIVSTLVACFLYMLYILIDNFSNSYNIWLFFVYFCRDFFGFRLPSGISPFLNRDAPPPAPHNAPIVPPPPPTNAQSPDHMEEVAPDAGGERLASTDPPGVTPINTNENQGPTTARGCS